MGNIQNIISSIQDIMWQDAGLDGDANRISQLVWMLFLKIFDDREENLELIDNKYKSPIPEKFRYRNWAKDDKGITGQELADFIDKELFPGLKDLSTIDPRGLIIKTVFSDTYNYMKNGVLIRRVFNKINEINFNKNSDRHAFGDLYEKILKDLQSAGSAGEFYTPRPLTRFIVETVNPKLGDKILDPACGTGGFLTNALEHMRKEVSTSQDEKKLHEQIHGIELKPLPHMLAVTNMILHGVEDPSTILRGDMLSRPYNDYGPKDRVDVILANPPFGAKVTDGTELNFPANFRTKETALLFLVLFVHLLKDEGRAGIVLPDGSLFSEGVGSKIKEHLLKECNVHTIIRLPQGVFQPYAGVNTNLIFFTKGKPTKEVWYYQMKLPEGFRQYTRNRPITDGEFDVVKEWMADKKENENAWKVSIEDIEKKNWNLDSKNPHAVEVEVELSSEELIQRVMRRTEEISKLVKEL